MTEVFLNEESVSDLKILVEELRRKLFPYADATEISGMSWNGFYLIGDRRSIKELQRIENRSSQLETYQDAFIERTKILEELVCSLEEQLTESEKDLRHWKSRAREAEHELTTGEGY